MGGPWIKDPRVSSIALRTPGPRTWKLGSSRLDYGVDASQADGAKLARRPPFPQPLVRPNDYHQGPTSGHVSAVDSCFRGNDG